MTGEQVDAALSRVLERQVSFKSGKLRMVCCEIVKTALQCNGGGGVWPDHPHLIRLVSELGGDDKNIVGSAWRLLGKVRVLERGAGRRRSAAGPSKGREIAEWRVVSRKLAETFIARNDGKYESPQLEMFKCKPPQPS